MCFYSYRSSVTHDFLNGSQQRLWIFFALKAVFCCLSQTVRHHSLMSSQKQIKKNQKFIIILKLGKPVQRASVQEEKKEENWVADYSSLIIGLAQITSLAFLNYTPNPQIPSWLGDREIQRRRRVGSKSLLSRFLFLFSLTQEHLPRDIDDNGTILINRLSSLTWMTTGPSDDTLSMIMESQNHMLEATSDSPSAFLMC